MLWDRDYDENSYEIYREEMNNELPLIREMLRDKRSATASGKAASIKPLYISDSGTDFGIMPEHLPGGIYDRLKTALHGKISGIPLGEKEVYFSVGEKVQALLFVHTCVGDARFVPSYRIKFDEFCPAVYAIRYSDGMTVFLNVRFGMDIGYIDMEIGRKINYAGTTPEDPGGFEVQSDKCPDPPLYALNSRWQNSLVYSASPFKSSGKYAYIMEWENPRPEIPVESVFAVNTAKTKEEQALLYLAAAVMF
jgi:hypothetical protein